MLYTYISFKKFLDPDHDMDCHEYLIDWSIIIIARDSICCKRAYAIAIPSVRPSVTRVDQSKTVEVRIMQFSLYSSPIPLVFPW